MTNTTNIIDFVLDLLPETAEDLFAQAVEAACAFNKQPLASCQGKTLKQVIERADELLPKRGALVTRLYSQIATGAFRAAWQLTQDLDQSSDWSWGSNSKEGFWSEESEDSSDLVSDAISIRDALLMHLRYYEYPGELPLAWDTSTIRPRPITDADEALEVLEAAARERRIQREREARSLWA